MGMSLPYIYYILRDIGVNYKNRILVSSDIETFSLTDSIELGPIVSAYDFSIWIFLVSGLLYMLATASVGLSLELDFIFDRLGKSEKGFI